MIDPAWALVAGPTIGVIGFFVAQHWPVEVDDDRNGLGVPDRQVRPSGGVSPNPQSNSTTQEEQEMSNYSMSRSEALAKALKYHEGDLTVTDSEVLETAEAFRKFLEGEEQTPEDPKSQALPEFKVPRLWDGYVYYRFEESAILYRSDIETGAMALGGVSRINLWTETEWVDAHGCSLVDTRHKLAQADGYTMLSTRQAEKLTRESLEGRVRFE